MANDVSESQRTIWNLKEKAQIMEQARIKAYENLLSEIVAETCSWRGISPEELPMKIAQRAFKLGAEFGANKMYEYL